MALGTTVEREFHHLSMIEEIYFQHHQIELIQKNILATFFTTCDPRVIAGSKKILSK